MNLSTYLYISFVFAGSRNWNKGKITIITSDSLYIEQYISKKDILTERESNLIVTGYELVNFKMIAYNNTVKAVSKGSLVLVIAMVVLAGGYGLLEESDYEKQKIKNKFFKKNVDFNKGWKAEIVLCE